jgi:hypothetical protein
LVPDWQNRVAASPERLATKKIENLIFDFCPSKFWSKAIMRLLLPGGRWRWCWSLWPSQLSGVVVTSRSQRDDSVP